MKTLKEKLATMQKAQREEAMKMEDKMSRTRPNSKELREMWEAEDAMNERHLKEQQELLGL